MLSTHAAAVVDVSLGACSYGFRLVATAVDSILETVLGTATTVITVLTNSPPAGGALAVTPANGTELETVFTLQASGWTDDAGDLPLTYTFSRLPGRFPVAAPQLWFPAAVKDAAGAVLNFQSLSSPLAVSRLSTILPVGDLVDGGATTLQVLVSDAFSAVSRVAAVVNVSRILDTIDQPLDLTALVTEQLGLVDAALAVRRVCGSVQVGMSRVVSNRVPRHWISTRRSCCSPTSLTSSTRMPVLTRALR